MTNINNIQAVSVIYQLSELPDARMGNLIKRVNVKLQELKVIITITLLKKLNNSFFEYLNDQTFPFFIFRKMANLTWKLFYQGSFF